MLLCVLCYVQGAPESSSYDLLLITHRWLRYFYNILYGFLTVDDIDVHLPRFI